MRLRDRARKLLRHEWTLVIVGKHSGHKTSLASIYKFSSQRAAMEQASRMNADPKVAEVTEYRVERRP